MEERDPRGCLTCPQRRYILPPYCDEREERCPVCAQYTPEDRKVHSCWYRTLTNVPYRTCAECNACCALCGQHAELHNINGYNLPNWANKENYRAQKRRIAAAVRYEQGWRRREFPNPPRPRFREPTSELAPPVESFSSLSLNRQEPVEQKIPLDPNADDICAVCLDQPATFSSNPCLHPPVACKDCVVLLRAQKQDTVCMICRADITGFEVRKQ